MRAAPFPIALLMLLAGCGQSDPDVLRAAPFEVGVGLEAGTDEPLAKVLDMRTTDLLPPGGVAGATVVTNPPLTTAGIGTPPAPYTLSGAEPTTPTTRPPATSVAAASVATTATPTTIATTTRGSETTQVVATTPAVDAADVVEFRISAGTQAGPWNSLDNPVRVTVGQILRVHNDDVVAHTLHSNGTPFEHGPTIEPGQFADHPIIATLTPDPAAPANYEHNAGVTAPFWVVSVSPDQSATAATNTAGATTASGPPGLATAEAESLRLLNELRVGLGAQPVTPTDREMHAFARAWSLEMRNTGFRHSNPPRWFENIVWYSDQAMTPAQAAARFHDMWVNSPGHYANMTNPDWSVVGVGMWHDESGWWGVHVFR